MTELGLREQLLAAASPDAAAATLRESGRLDSTTLEALLVDAAAVVRDDPGVAERLAQVAILGAEASDAPSVRPRAEYLIAQVRAGAGDLAGALVLIDSTREEFARLGMAADALRTNLGRLHVLNEMGLHADALTAGESILAAADTAALEHDVMLELTAAAYQNIGLCHELTGRFSEALAAYAASESRYRELGEIEGMGEVAYDRGLILLALGRAREALSAFRSAADVFAKAELRALHAAALTSMAEAHLLQGDFARCLQVLHDARDELATIDAPSRDHARQLAAARAYLALNCFSEALEAYRAAESWLGDAGMVVERARASWGVGLALSGMDRADDARLALDEAASAFAFSGQTQLLAAVLVERAALEARHGALDVARQTAREALELARTGGLATELIGAHLRLAELVDPAEADVHLAAALTQAEETRLLPLQVAACQSLGRRRLASGRIGSARELFERAAGGIELLRTSLAHEALLGNFLHDKAGTYEGLIECELATPGVDHGERVLAAMERASARSLAELAAGLVHRDVDPSSSDAEREQLEGELHAVYTELFGEGATAQREGLRTRAELLERQLSRLRLDSVDVKAGPLDTRREQQATRDFPVVAYHCLGDRIIAVVAAAERATVFELPGAAEVVVLLERLAAQWERFRLGPEFVSRHAVKLEQATVQVLGSLYDALIAPIEAELPLDGPLAILPHGPLHSVPWSALHDGDGYLVDRYEVFTAPSLAVLDGCRARRVSGRRGALIVGVADEFAPAIEDEVAAIATRLPGARCLVGGLATAETVSAELPGSSIVHLAGHGLWRSDNPMFSALRLADRWLTAAELLPLDLRGALVVLSACDTARSHALAGNELLGMARAVLGAGAATLVASQWQADDEATATLMDRFYQHVSRGQSPAQALTVAKRALRREREHPYYWAAFEVLGAP